MKKRVLLSLLLGGGLVLGTSTGALATKANPITKDLEDIVVTATQTEHTLADVPEATTVITAKELELQNATNALEALRWVPGINLSLSYGGHGQEGYKIGGVNSPTFLSSSYALILINGNRPKSRWPLSDIPVSMIERIEIIKGANSLLYGSDAMSGVINVITKKAPEKCTGSVIGAYSFSDEDSNTESISIGFSLGKLRQLYSYKRDDSEDDVVKRDSFMGKFGVDLGETADLEFSIRASQLNNHVRNQSMDVDTYDFSTNLKWDIDDLSSLKAKLFLRKYKDQLTASRKVDSFYNEQEIIYTRLLGGSHLLTAGYQRMAEDWDYVAPTKKESKDPYSNNLFLQDEITLSESFIVVPALRVGFYSDWDNQVNPKLSMLWKATDSLNLRASWGTAFKTPGDMVSYMKFFHPVGPSGFWIIGNPDLEPEKSRSLRISAEKRFGEKFLGSIAIFRNDFDNMIGGYMTKKELEGLKIYTFKNIQDARSQGAEIELKYHMTDHIMASMGYAYLDAEDEASGESLYNTVEHKISPMIRYNNPNMGFVVQVRADYEKYATATSSGDKDDFIVNANISKQLTDHIKLWINGENIFDEEPREGLSKGGIKTTFGLNFSW